MKAAVLTGLRQIESQERPDPEIREETDVLLKIERVGVCGSDVHYFETGRIGSQVIAYPFVVGHECAGVVQAVGRGVTRVSPGDRVAVDPAIWCGTCDQCRAGREHTCRNLLFLGCPGQVAGCLCEQIVMPESSCFILPEGLTMDQGVLAEPLAISMYAVQQSGVGPGQTIGILGSGPIGLGCLIAAQAQGVQQCFVTERIAERLEMARNRQAAWVGNPDREDVVGAVLSQCPDGLDVVFECAGQQETIDQAIAMLKPGGRLMLIGITRTDTITVPIHTLRRKELGLINVRRQNQCTQKALDAMESGQIDADFMVTHRFDLAQCQYAFEWVEAYRDGVVKAMIDLK